MIIKEVNTVLSFRVRLSRGDLSDAQRTATARASENTEERCRRQAADAQRTATARASENAEERCSRQAAEAQRISNVRYVVWRQKENSAFQYSSNICYESDPLIAIGQMTLEYNFCQALRWKGVDGRLACVVAMEKSDFIRCKHLHCLSTHF
ncbi:hypothetical protein AVEN_73481-1 [Araneus ventricosus]|uniref:Uncharacterized protein n=1 Tax=Araneus ventricosus TaxID=182803 RepID=A0A4Y2L2C2_ARAVE|nr:hypothetical protein AVEN_73481-1 [Araneus ventricosus]